MKLKVRNEYYTIPDDLYNKYVALYSAEANAWVMTKTQKEYDGITTYTNSERMKIHKEILRTLGVFPDTAIFNTCFLDRVRKDSHAVVFDSQLSTQTTDKIKLNMLFDEVKRLAVERKEAMDKLCTEYELQYDKEFPDYIPDSDGVEWQDVLLWGIKDLQFDDFLAVLAESEDNE